MNFREPILAASLLPKSKEHTDDQIFEAMKKLKYPVMATIKKDGIRALRLNGTLLSRWLKRIPNKVLREASIVMPGGFDMEIFNKAIPFHDTQSIVMSAEHIHTDQMEFHILDWISLSPSYAERCNNVANWMTQNPALQHKIKFSPPLLCSNAEQLYSFFRLCEEEAGEGICFRLPNSPYKQGRSTLKEQYLVKLARFHSAEARIIGFMEQLTNENKPRTNLLGRTQRASYQHNLVPKNTLGALIVRDLISGIEFNIGTGFDDAMRQEIWNNRSEYFDKIVSYRCKKHGEKVKPRSPSFRGMRKEADTI